MVEAPGFSPVNSAFHFIVCHHEPATGGRGICFFYPLPTIHYPLPYEMFRVRHGRVTSLASAMLRMMLEGHTLPARLSTVNNTPKSATNSQLADLSRCHCPTSRLIF